MWTTLFYFSNAYINNNGDFRENNMNNLNDNDWVVCTYYILQYMYKLVLLQRIQVSLIFFFSCLNQSNTDLVCVQQIKSLILAKTRLCPLFCNTPFSTHNMLIPNHNGIYRRNKSETQYSDNIIKLKQKRCGLADFHIVWMKLNFFCWFH